MRIQATPYVPGQVRGVLRLASDAAAAETLAVVSAAELANLNWRPAGALVVDGAPLSHAMIQLFGAGIPTVILNAEQAAGLPIGREAELDGTDGSIEIPPREVASTSFEPVPSSRALELVTADGVAVRLLASIAGAEGAKRAIAQGAAGIGLVRSEFLAPEGGRVPDTVFYERVFTQLCQAAAPLRVTLRLIDLAPDKHPDWLGVVPGGWGTLGLQGARLYGEKPVRGLFLSQLEAVDRIASRFGLSLLVPYITHPEEFRIWRDEIQQRLAHSLPLGAMAETPSALLQLPALLELADFVAVGCNDLLQSVFCADRDLAVVSSYLDPYSPAVYRLLQYSARLAEDRLGRVRLCGLLSQLPGLLPVLIGLGYRAFSVEPLLIPWLAQTVAATRLDAAKVLADRICAAASSDGVRRLLGLPLGVSWAPG